MATLKFFCVIAVAALIQNGECQSNRAPMPARNSHVLQSVNTTVSPLNTSPIHAPAPPATAASASSTISGRNSATNQTDGSNHHDTTSNVIEETSASSTSTPDISPPSSGQEQPSCKADKDCPTGMKCDGKLCQCPKPDDMTYNNTAKTCEIKAGAPCKEGESEFLCAKHSNCVSGTCRCSTGYSVTSKGQCLGDYRTECSNEEDCNMEAILTCAEDNGKKTCGCMVPANQTYEGGKCLAKAGSMCNLEGLAKLGCIKNAQCQKAGTGNSNGGTCVCNKGLKRNENGLCSGVATIFSSGILLAVALMIHKGI